MSTAAETVVAGRAELKGSALLPRPGVSETGELEIPTRAEDVELLGRVKQSGHREPPALVRRGDGQVVQVTPILYEVLSAIDGRRDHEQLAGEISQAIGRPIKLEQVRWLIEEKLRPLGLLREPDGAQPALRKANPLLALKGRVVVTNTRITNRIAMVFAPLFAGPLVVAFTVAFAAVIGWLFFSKGLAAPMRQALYEPQLLLMVFALTALSAGFHELGHAAACRYGGGKPGAMGFGLYLLWPAFYTDVTDSYRLERGKRLRVDLGGMYFNAVFAVAAFALWSATGWDALLIVVPLQLLQMLRHLIPLVRLDGYHILADLTGVPDLFAYIKPVVGSMVPFRKSDPKAKNLRLRARIVVTLWVIAVIPILLFTLLVIVMTLPRIAATAWDSIGLQWNALQESLSEKEYASAGLGLVSIVAIGLPVLSMGYLLSRVVRRTARRVWRTTESHPIRRGVAVLALIGIVAGLVTAWWPHGQYRPIEANDRATFVDVRFRPPALFDRTSTSDVQTRDAAFTSVGDLLPDPGQGDGLLPGEEPEEVEGIAETTSGDLPFALPSPPGTGDNQALAVNTEDGATVTDLAFELLTLAGGDVDNRNEAYALASCMACATVAVAFQVILVLEEADVVVPQNVAAALNAFCERCLTYAVAMQMIFTIDEPLSKRALREVAALMRQMERLEKKGSKLSFEELLIRVDGIRIAILALLAEEGAIALEPADWDEQGDVPTPELIESPSPSGEPESSPSPSPTDAETTASPSPEPSGSPSEEPSPEPSP